MLRSSTHGPVCCAPITVDIEYMKGSHAKTYPCRGPSVTMRPLPSGSRVGSMLRDGWVQIDGATSGEARTERGVAGLAGVVKGGGRPRPGDMAWNRSSMAPVASAQACIGSASAHQICSWSGPCCKLNAAGGDARHAGIVRRRRWRGAECHRDSKAYPRVLT